MNRRVGLLRMNRSVRLFGVNRSVQLAEGRASDEERYDREESQTLEHTELLSNVDASPQLVLPTATQTQA